MPPAKKPPPKVGVLTRHATKASWTALLIAVLTFLTTVLGIVQNGPSTHSVKVIAKRAAVPAARQQAKIAAATALKVAARSLAQTANGALPANQSCSVPAGQGAMGACAPKVAQLRVLGAAPSGHVRGLVGTDTSSFQSCQRPPGFVAFWIVKFTEGVGYRDRCAAQNIADAKAMHIVYGGYDFMRATGTNAASEAAVYIDQARRVGATRGLHVLDVEANGLHLPSGVVHAYVCDWVNRVKAAFGGPVVIYTGNWFWGPSVGGSSCGAVLWDSAYASYAQLPGSWGGGYLALTGFTNDLNHRGGYRAVTPLWQYSDGVYGPYPRVNRWDTDAFFGNRRQLERLAGLVPKPRPVHKRKRATRVDQAECRHLMYDRHHRPPYARAAHKRWRALHRVGVVCTRTGAHVAH